MNRPIAFDKVIEAGETLETDVKAELAAVLSRRLAERGRERWEEFRVEALKRTGR